MKDNALIFFGPVIIICGAMIGLSAIEEIKWREKEKKQGVRKDDIKGR